MSHFSFNRSDNSFSADSFYVWIRLARSIRLTVYDIILIDIQVATQIIAGLKSINGRG